GSDSFAFKATDNHGLDSNVATVSITVTAVNDAPVAQDGTLTTAEDTASSGTVVATDVDTATDGDVLTYAVVSVPAHGTLTFNSSTGAFTYAPDTDFNGTDSFTFKATDGAADSNIATVSVTVTAVNDAPVLSVPA